MKPLCLTALLSAAILAGSPQAARAQTEPLAVGVSVTTALGAKPWSIASLRVSVPAGERLGIDIDTGGVFGAGDLTTGFIPHGFAFAAHVRWIFKKRSSRGTSAYLLGGARTVRGTDQPRGGPRVDAPFTGADIGIGLDYAARAVRFGGEIGNGSAGEAALPFATAFFLFRFR